jgi:hypothetical protein
VTTIRDRLAVSAAIVIVGLTAAAFWLSYAHLHTVASDHGLNGSPARSWAWPATLDAFVIAGDILMLRASLSRRTDWWAIGLTVTGSGGSIALNVFGVQGADPLAYVVAAVPPTAALLAFGALMRQIHSHLAERSDEELPAETATTSQPVTARSAPASRRTATASPALPVVPAASGLPPVILTKAASASPTAASPSSQTTANSGSVYLPDPASPPPTATPAAATSTDPATPAAGSQPSPTATASKPATGTDQRDLDDVADAFRTLRDELGRSPSDQALANRLGVGRSRAQQLRTAAIKAGHTDLEKPLRAAS